MQVFGINGVNALRRVIVDGLGGGARVRRVLAAPGDVLLSPVYAHKARTLEGFLLIAGYNRSGSTLIGSMLNAHPDAVVVRDGKSLLHVRLPGSTKGMLVRRILREERRECRKTNSYRRIFSGGYSYHVETEWQGRYARLRLVGDQDAFTNINWLHEDPALLDFLRRRLGCPLRVLFTYRNPYDMVAAWCLRAPEGAGGAGVFHHVALRNLRFPEADRPDLASRFLTNLRDYSRRVSEVLARIEGDEVLPIRHERFVARPKDILRDMLRFVGLNASDAYLTACAALVEASPHRTRFKVRWTPVQIAEVEDIVRTYSWFDGYTFDS